jgi:kynureninase
MSWRDRFLVPEGIYLLSHSVGCLPRSAEAAVQQMLLTPWAEHGGDAWPQWLETIDGFCAALAGLLGGRAEDYCPQTNLSSALTKYLCALPPDPSRNRVVMHESAFPSLGFVVQALGARGLTLDIIPADRSAADPDVWRTAMGDDVRAAIVMHVHSNSGVRSPVAELVPLFQASGAHVIVDIAQSAGVVPLDIGAWQADAVIGSCVKWLCGGPGAGFLWVNPDKLALLQPDHVGWFSHADPFAFDIRDFRYSSTARRFWGGTPSVAPFVLAKAGIETIAAIGIEAIAAHNRRCREIVEAHIGPHSSFVPAAQSGGTLCLTLPAERIVQATATLTANAVRFDQRGSTLRLSFHAYNSEDEALRVGEIADLHF